MNVDKQETFPCNLDYFTRYFRQLMGQTILFYGPDLAGQYLAQFLTGLIFGEIPKEGDYAAKEATYDKVYGVIKELSLEADRMDELARQMSDPDKFNAELRKLLGNEETT